LIYVGEARKEGEVNDYLVHEMARIRIEELREEAKQARGARGSRRRGHYLGILGGLVARRTEGEGFSRGTVEEACCA
jgi:hypothetical protein